MGDPREQGGGPNAFNELVLYLLVTRYSDLIGVELVLSLEEKSNKEFLDIQSCATMMVLHSHKCALGNFIE